MDDVEHARKVFRVFYAKLSELSMNDLVAELYANELLPGDHKAKVESHGTQREKAQYFLDSVIKPSLNIGCTEPFNKLITIMESSDNYALQFLANQIRKYYGVGVPNVFSDDKSKGLAS